MLRHTDGVCVVGGCVVGVNFGFVQIILWDQGQKIKSLGSLRTRDSQNDILLHLFFSVDWWGVRLTENVFIRRSGYGESVGVLFGEVDPQNYFEGYAKTLSKPHQLPLSPDRFQFTPDLIHQRLHSCVQPLTQINSLNSKFGQF